MRVPGGVQAQRFTVCTSLGGVYVCVHTWAAVYTHVRTNACLFGYTGATVNTCEDVKMFGVCERVSGRGDIGLGCAGLGLVASPAG